MRNGKKTKSIPYKVMTATGLACMLMTSVVTPMMPLFETVANAEVTNPLLGSEYASPYEYSRGSTYWTTSNIREWLNSGTEKVIYTNDAPDQTKLGSRAYADEAGFLHGFTSEELSGIAVTQRRSFVSTNLGSGSWEGGTASVPRYDGLVPSPFFHISSPNINTAWKSIYYQTVNDKIFTLSPHELYEYVQKRGISYKKGMTDEAKVKFNISSDSYPYSTSSYNYSNRNSNSLWGIDSAGRPGYSDISGNSGIVPAMHLKADFALKDGRKASQLQVGDVFVFGKYNNAPIEWRVINKTPEGNPLLWAEKILTLKAYDAPGDLIYRNSISVNFPVHDVSIKDDLKYTNGKTDTTTPTIRVTNTSALSERQNGSFTINIEATDTESGIDHIVMPDGTKVYSTSVNYVVTENGRYYFTAVDKAGNHYGFEVPVGNINPPANVVINTSANGWTNKDVTVDISTTQTNTTWEKSSVQTPKYSGSGMVFPEYTTYAGKRFRITGQVRLVSAKDTQYHAVVRMMYDQVVPTGSNYYVAKTYPAPVMIPLKDLSTTAYTSFDTTYTVGGAYFGKLQPVLGTTAGNIDTASYQIEWKDVKVELLDKEDFSIQKIILPNGTEIQAETYRDVLTQEGVYTYKVLDSRGKITEKTVEVKIDKNAPLLTISGVNATPTNKDVTLQVNATDSQSGIKRIQKPNGEWVSLSSFSYLISQNGSYTFTVEDVAGNTKSQTVTISNIDKTPPNSPQIQVSTTSPTNQDVSVTINYSTDSVTKEYRINGGVWKSYTSPIIMSSNGTVEARATDELGNTTAIETYQVSNIDKVAPTTPTMTSDLTTPTNTDVRVTIQYPTDASKKEYRINGGSWQTYSSPVVMQANGLIEARGYDVAGNLSVTASHAVSNIDKVMPYSLEAPYSVDGYWINKDQYKVVVKGVKDDATGIEKVVFPSWTEYNGQDDLKSNWWVSGYDGVKTAEGTWEFTVNASEHNDEDGLYHTHVYAIDKAGNRQILGGVQVKLDRIAPTETVITVDKTAITNQDVTITLTYPMDAIKKEYRVNGGAWTTYTTPVLMSENGRIEARSFDEANNQSLISSYDVINIDKTNPETPILSASTTVVTNKDVQVTIQFPSDSAIKQYRLNGGTWQAYNSPIVMTTNGAIEARAFDEAGNSSSVSTLSISNIDKIAPNSPTITPSVTASTNQNVTLTVNYSSDSKIKEYRINGSSWQNYSSPLVMEVNGTVEVRAYDEAGNASSLSSYQVNNIDKMSPEKPVVFADKTTATNEDVVVSFFYPSDAKVKLVRKNGGAWETYTAPVVFTQNGTVEARAYDEAGNVSPVASYSVNNIDKVAPNVPKFVASENQNKIVATKDDDAVLLYKINEDIWKTYEGEIVLQDGTFKIVFKAIDEAGNVSPLATGDFVLYRDALSVAESKVMFAESNVTQENVTTAYSKVDLIPHNKPEYQPFMKRLDDLQALLDAQKAIETAIVTRNEADVQLAQQKISLLNNSNPVILDLMDAIQAGYDEADILALVAKERYDLLSTRYQMSKDSYTALVNIYYAIKYTGDFMYKYAGEKVALVPVSDKHYDFVQVQYQNLMDDYGQFVAERIQTDAEIKAESSVKTMETKYDPSMAVNTQNLINVVEDPTVRASLQARLDTAKAKYEASLLAKVDQEAVTAVEKAEQYRSSYYVTEAYKKVNYLTNAELKFELTNRLQKLEADMVLEKQVSDATKSVQLAEQYPSTTTYLTTAQTKVNALPDITAKAELQARIDKLKAGLDQTKVVKDANSAVSLAQSMKTQYYVDKARVAISLVLDEAIRLELTKKVDAIIVK